MSLCGQCKISKNNFVTDNMEFNQEITNEGLSFSMEFGQNWLKPINERLSKKYSELLPVELEKYNKLCKDVNTYANDFILNNPVKHNDELIFLPFEKFKKVIHKKYAWINEDNLKQLYSQSCYYAWK